MKLILKLDHFYLNNQQSAATKPSVLIWDEKKTIGSN